MLVGRDVETSLISTILDEARGGRSKVLIITGEAGIGKSALLGYAAEMTDGLVLSTGGIQGESDIAYVHLADLFRTVHSSIEHLPPRQAAALASVFAIGPSIGTDRFTVAAATLNLLGAVAAAGPVTILVDDAQWIDQASLEILIFVAHRLDAEGIALLFAMRPEQSTALRFARFSTITLRGMDETASRALITSTSAQPMGTGAMARLVAEAGGNPLALIELPSLMTPVQLALWTRGQDPLPIDSLLQEAYCGSLRDLPAETRRAVILLAVLGGAARQVLEPALAAGGLRTDHFDPAEQAGLILDSGSGLEFRHPLVRAAVFQTSPPALRRRAHLCAAAVLADSGMAGALDHRAWHLVAAGGQADETLATVLENAAAEEFASNNFAAAGRLFERSAELTPERGPVDQRLVRAAKCIRLTGAIAESYALLKRARQHTADPRLMVAIRYSMCRIEMWRSPTRTGRDELTHLAVEVADADPTGAAAMLTDAALASVEIGDLQGARSAAAHAMGLVRTDGSAPPLSVAAVAAMVSGLGGDSGTVQRLLSSRSAEVDAIDPLATDLVDQLTLVISLAHLCVEEVERARTLLERAVTGARHRSAIGVLPFRLGRLAWVQWWEGRWSAARASAHEALQLAEDTGWANERPSSLATLARIEAATGRHEDCRHHAAESITDAERMGGRPYVAYAHTSLGLLELSVGNHLAAIEHLTVMAEFAARSGISDTPVLWWSGDLIEAYVRCGRLAKARDVLERFEASAARSRITTAAAVAARSRALLEPEDCDRYFAEALSCHDRARMPFERARTELCLGASLRRRRLRANARDYLRAALATFERLGAVDWAETTRNELRATGVRLSQPHPGLAHLTPQELQVTLAVVRGLSNREVAAQLFLSVKTVEFHLAHVYDKAGVSRRTQLAALVARQESTA